MILEQFIERFDRLESRQILELTYNAEAVQMLLTGTNWTLRIGSAWRIREGSALVIGWSDQRPEEQLRKLVGMSLVSVEPQSRAFPIDPSFGLSDGSYLDVFGDVGYDPWVFRFEEITYVGGGTL